MERKILWADTARRLSHSVRKHIANILLATQHIQKQKGISADMTELSAIIVDEVRELKKFIRAFQRFSELEELALEKVDIKKFMLDYIANFMPNKLDNITFIKDIKVDLPPVMLDRTRFIELLTNILNNSYEAMPEGGTISLSVFRWQNLQTEKFMEDYIAIEIQDTGKGVPEKYLEKITKPFFTTKENGTGIGLAEAKKVLEGHKGKLEIHSKEGLGTTVIIYLPIIKD